MTQHPKYLLLNGELVAYDDARVHVLSTAFKYGAIVFEGLRAYWNEEQGELFGFRLDDHFYRLIDSMKVTRMEGSRDVAQYREDLLRLIRANELRENIHMRVQVYVDADDGGMASTEPISIFMAALPMPTYFGKDALHVTVSSWTRISDRAMPPRIKAAPNYHNSRFALLQARADGYDDAILLTPEGTVSEGPGYSLFAVRRGRIITPPITAGILESVTRDTLITLAGDLGIPVEERAMDRTELYVADEVWFSGSAAEVTPILSVDRLPVGDGRMGPITAAIRERYLATVRGEMPDTYGWLTPIYAGSGQEMPAEATATTAR